MNDMSVYSSRLARKHTRKKCIYRLKHGDDPDELFDQKQLAIGTKIEMEHTDDLEIAKKISKAHLSERSDYYSVLKKVGL